MLAHSRSSLFSTYSPVLARQILRRVPTSLLQARFTASPATHAESADGSSKSTTTSLPPRPYTFHIGASWAGKPEYPTIGLRKVPFPPDTLIGSWRDQTLSRNSKAIGTLGTQSLDPGEDFFFIQEVRFPTFWMVLLVSLAPTSGGSLTDIHPPNIKHS